MAQIISNSGVSAGSLYRFFPNKMAVAHALAERHREGIEPLQHQFAPASSIEEVLGMLDLVVDVTVHHQETTPGYQAIREVFSVNEPGPVHQARQDQIELFTGLVSDVASHLPEDDIRRMISYVATTIDVLTRDNPHPDDDQARRVVELKRLLRAYVRDTLEA